MFHPLLQLGLMALAATPPGRPATQDVLVGVLSPQARKHCTGDFRLKWVDPHFQVGFVRLIGPDDGLAAMAGRPVVAFGEIDRDFQPTPIVHDGQCPVPQMRSDWVDGPHGMRVRRDPRPLFGAFRQRRVVPWEGLKARRDGDELVISIAAPDGMPLTGPTTVVVHYEGCYGKPGTAEHREILPELPMSPPRELRAPALKTETQRRPGRQVHRASTVQIIHHAERLTFDLNMSLYVLGADVECPPRR